MSGIMNMFVATKTTIATAVDAFFNSVSLLLNTSSTNGAQNNTFLDSSTNNFTITRNGNTTQGTFTPFSQTGWSNYFSTSDYVGGLATTVYDFSTSEDFSVEFFAYLTNVPSSFGFTGGNASSAFGFVYDTSAGYLKIQKAAVANVLTTSYVLLPNTWYHIVGCRQSGTLSIFVNGVRQATASDTTSFASTAGFIGGNTGFASVNGYISNFRVLTGGSAYNPSSSTLTVPTAPLTAITNTAVLTCQSNRFIDNSASPNTLTVNGTPSVQAFSPFAPTAAYDTAVVGGSGYFDGTGDYLVTPSNAAVSSTLLASDFTIECWLYLTTYPGNGAPIWTNSTSNSDGFSSVYVTSSGTVALGKVGVNEVVSTATVVRNAWNHFATVRSGSTVYLYLNGAQIASGAASTYLDTSTAKPLQIAQSNQSSPSNLTGYISGYRAVSSALYTGSTYTIPTSVPTAISGTTLLLNFTNSGIFDSTAKNVLETVGNAQVSTTQAKWGTTSMYFDGTGDVLKAPYTPNIDFGTGDFTIECWVYTTNVSPGYSQTVLARWGASGGTVWIVQIQNGGTYRIVTGAGAWTGGSVSANTWTHLAITRSGSSLRVFTNGTLSSTNTDTTSLSGTQVLSVGAQSDVNDPFIGYIDDVRITKGYARYTATFTPPAAAFPLQ